MAELLFDSADSAPEAIRGQLAEKDGKFVFRYEPPERVDEFRNNNIRLQREREQFEAQLKAFEGLDPEKAREAAKRIQEIEDKQLIEKGQLDELVTQRTQREREKLRADYEPKLKEATTAAEAYRAEVETLRSELEARDLERDLQKAAADKKIKSNKLAYLTTMARHGDPSGVRWTRRDGRMVAVRGDEQLDVTFSDWIDGLIKADPDLVVPSAGGGAIGSTGGAGNRSGKDTTGLSPRQLLDSAYSRH